jgi:hypothetical protein
MATTRRRRDPYTRNLVCVPERDLAECVLEIAAPVLDALGPAPPPEEARRAIELAIDVWNAHARASPLWGVQRTKPLADLERKARSKRAPAGLAEAFERMAARWKEEHRFDPRLVGTWSYDPDPGRLTCETTLPEGVEAPVPPPLEKRVRIGGKFLDETSIRLNATSFLGFPVEAHHGELASDGTVTIRTKLATVVALFAERVLPPIDGASVDVMVGGKEVGPRVLAGVRCTGYAGSGDGVELTLRPPSTGA